MAKRLTEDDKVEITRLIGEGLSSYEIAKKTGRTRFSITGFACRYKLHLKGNDRHPVLTDEAKVRELAARGMSTGEIAAEMGENVTRGMVAGFCSRRKIRLLGRSGGSSRQATQNREAISKKSVGWIFKKRDAKNIVPPMVILEDKPPASGGISLLSVEFGQCRWIIGDARALLCCGEPTLAGKSWCPDHQLRGHVPYRPPKPIPDTVF